MKALVLLLGLATASFGAFYERAQTSEAEAARIDLVHGEWPGPALSYSGYRAGQSPEHGVFPSREQVAEDLRILARSWRLIRVYAADQHSEDVLSVIREEELDLAVMLGVWLGREPGAEEPNAQQVAAGIRLAKAYEDVVVAVNVGNEVRVEWTQHPVPEQRLVGYVREVREAVKQPVTMADNYVWWRDHGAALAREVDFITMHTYPIWERKDIDEGLSYTIENFEGVRAAHPDKRIVIGEAGWASYTEGNLHVPRAGDEVKQERYYRELMDWARKEEVTVFWFSAFDEPWKDSGTEGHWGLFTADRKAKPVMRALFPDLVPDGPTSPSYPDRIVPTGPALSVAFRAELARAIPGGSVNPLGPGLASSDVVTRDGAEGGTALQLSMTGESWGGVYFTLDAYDAGAAEAVALRLRLPEGVAALELKLEDTEASSGSVELMEHATGRDDAGWTSFSVPLSEFTKVERSQLAVLGLWNPRGKDQELVKGSLEVDDVHFE
jgi:exo-beta-1,3-glucanase (GH17 family)